MISASSMEIILFFMISSFLKILFFPAELPFPQQKKSPHCRGSAGAGPPISRIGAANPVAAGAGSGGQRI